MIAKTSDIAHDHLSTKSTVLALKMYQVEGTIWGLVRILSSKWSRVSVKKVQTLQSIVLSMILLASDYEVL